MNVQFMYWLKLSGWIRSYIANSWCFEFSRRSSLLDPGNKQSCLAKRWSTKDNRRRESLENVHNVWFISNGAGHTGRRQESRSRPASGWGDNQRTRANTIESACKRSDLGKSILWFPKPEILINIWICHTSYKLHVHTCTYMFIKTRICRPENVYVV